jgi:hypothetical protein
MLSFQPSLKGYDMIPSPRFVSFTALVAASLLCGCGLTLHTGGKGAVRAVDHKVPEGTELVSSHGYQNCVRLFNNSVSVVLEPNCGGRVIEYTLNGENVLYLDPAQDGWIAKAGQRTIEPYGGRSDIGPELIAPQRPVLWRGAWTAEIIGPRSARLTSLPDSSSGMQLVREFQLDANGSHLRFTQTMKNVSTVTKRYCHWGRTTVLGGGICLVPLSEWSKFPRGFMMYDTGSKLAYRMQNTETVGVRDRFFEITGPTPQPKFGIDSYAGWLGYITKNNLLMVKRFPTYMDRAYGDISGFPLAIYYSREVFCELEPLGPMETLDPGSSASFTEDWWLFNYQYPGTGNQVDLKYFSDFVAKNAQ